jgi:hypothetical protein
VRVVLDRVLMEETLLNFPPMAAGPSLRLTPAALTGFLQAHDHQPQVIDSTDWTGRHDLR